MHLLLTDRLTCPRCGPEFGLILLADKLVDRVVHSGVLGCPNCRDAFEVEEGFADLRAPPRRGLEAGRAGDGKLPKDEQVERVVALLGLHRGPGTVATLGSAAVFAAPISESVEDLMVVAVDSETRKWALQNNVTRMVSSPGLPFFDRTLRGVVVDGELGAALLFEACRCVSQMSRVVVLDAKPEAEEVVLEAGLSVLAIEQDTLVASRG
ncbi:MAG: hypothetical protein CME03_05495 [Gemmatimonadaceae bacterium]|nr:hypothetical protein [Gemmatimonadaceae bacterium]